MRNCTRSSGHVNPRRTLRRRFSMDSIPNIELNKRDNIRDNQSINRSVGWQLFPSVVGPRLTDLNSADYHNAYNGTIVPYRASLPPVYPSISIPKEVSIEEPALITQPLNHELFDPEPFPLLNEAAGTPPLILIIVEFFQPRLTLPQQSPGTEDGACQVFRHLSDLQIAQTRAVFRWQF